MPWIDRKDIGLIGLLPVVAALAWTLPEGAWPMLAVRLAGLHLAVRGGRVSREVARIEALVGTRSLGRSPAACWRAHIAHKYVALMQLLHSYHPRGWPAAIRLEGRVEIDAALALGQGAILWVTQFVFSDLVTKRALHEAGYAVSHLSREAHGFSTTRFGRRWLNPIKTGIERRYLAERLVMSEDHTVGPLRGLALRLRQNRLVSITVAPTGRKTRPAPFLDSRIRVATGAPALAWQTGAPLLPVFTLREPAGALVTRVEPALLADRRLDRAGAIDALLTAYGALLEAYVLRSPDQFPLAYLVTDRAATAPQ